MLSLRNTITSINGRNKFSTSAATEMTDDYISYVATNAGVTESISCLTAAYFDAGVRNSFDYINSIFQRWTLDGATIEGTACFTNSFFLLNTQL